MDRGIWGRRNSILSWALATTVFFVMALGSPQASAAGDGARVVKYSKEDIVPVHAKVRF
jgi:hypothetical protein